MEIFQIVAIGFIATILSIIVKKQSPEIGIYISIVTGILIFLFVISKLQAVLVVLNQLSAQIQIDDIFLVTILKIVGIAYVAEFGAQICKDAGEGVIASKIEFAGKILIMFLAVPILVSLMDLIINIVP